MKKIYQKPSTRTEEVCFTRGLANGLDVTGSATSNTPVDAKHRGFTVEDEEEEEAILHLMVDRENGNTSDLW